MWKHLFEHMQMVDTGGGGGPGGGGGGSFIHYDALDISKEVGHEGHGSAELVYVAPSARSLRTQVDIRVRNSKSKDERHGSFPLLWLCRQRNSCSAARQALASWCSCCHTTCGGGVISLQQ